MGDKPSPSSEERLLVLFDRLRRTALGQNPLEDSGVTAPQLALLDRIASTPGSGIQEIARGLGLTAPTVSVGVRRLEEAGWLERRPNPVDGRAIGLFLTGQGAALQQRARAFRLDKMRQLLVSLAPQEREKLLSLLERAVTATEEAKES